MLQCYRSVIMLQCSRSGCTRSAKSGQTNGHTSTTSGQTDTTNWQTVLQVDRRMGRQVLWVDWRVLRVHKRVVRVDKWFLGMVRRVLQVTRQIIMLHIWFDYWPFHLNFRSSHRRRSVRKGVLRKFAKFTRKHLWRSLFFNKVAGLRQLFLLKERLLHRCFPVNFAKFLRKPFLQNTSGWLLV